MTALPSITTPAPHPALGVLVSYFENAFRPEPAEQVPLGDILERIKGGIWGEAVIRIRRFLERQNEKGYQEAKRTLPAFTMSGACLTRDAQTKLEAKFIGHSGVLQCDFDKKDNPALDLATITPHLHADPHVLFGFVSPSGAGLKCGLCIDGSRHAESFAAAEAYFLATYGLQIDKSTKDPLRLCFVSCDEALWLNHAATCLPIPARAAPAQAPAWSPPLESTAEDIREMLRFIPPRPDYGTWLRIASAVWSSLSLADGCQLLAEWSPEEKAGEYADKHRHRLAQVGIGTLVHYAQQYGFDARAAARRKVWAGRLRFADAPRDRTAAGLPEDIAQDPAALPASVVEIDREYIANCFDDAQVGDARLWCARRQGQKLYDHLRQSWRTYDRGVWLPDDTQGTILEVSDQTAGVYSAQIETIRAAMRSNPAPEDAKDARAAQVEKLRSRIAKLRSKSYLGNVADLAKSQAATKATDFDQHPHLFCLQNGVIDFASGVFREHRPGDMLTHRAPYGFEPEATCPGWLRFLDFAFSSDHELIAYLARVTGYMLTGYVDKDALFFHYGKGANGKSTYTGVMQMLLGEMSTTIGIEALLAKQADNNFDYKKAMLEGKRVAFTDEIPENRVLSDSAVKALVGGDMITARRPYEKPYNFAPTHKLILVGNHKPEIKGTDHGIWRRIHLIPWLNTIPEAQRRPRHEIHAEMRAELPGIFNWALRGFLDMAEGGGLRPPEVVMAATKDYQTDSDQLARFLDERTEPALMAEVLASKVLKAYMAWCEDAGEIPRYRSARKLIGAMREKGHQFRTNGDKVAVLQGVSLVATGS